MNKHRRPKRFGDRLHSTRYPTIDELKTAARGQWVRIFADAGLSSDLLDGRGHPCPLCRGNDRFTCWPDVADRGAVHCRHCFTAGTDPKPGDGLATLRWLMGCDTLTACKWLAGWLGLGAVVDRPDPPPMVRTITMESPSETAADLSAMAKSCFNSMRPEMWKQLSDRLTLPIDTLERLRVGVSIKHHASTWPMVNDAGVVVGVRLRYRNNKKASVKGGKAGLFVPDGLSDSVKRLFITEGPTDCAAMLSLGFDAIGRPSCNGAVAVTTRLVNRLRPSECVLVADDDEHEAGKRGAESLASVLVLYCPAVRIIYPPKGVKDARAWVTSGATTADVEAVVDAAIARSLVVTKGPDNE